MNIQDHFSESLQTVFGLKILDFLMPIWIRDLFDLDPGWKNSGPGSGLNIPDPQHWCE
jgi:hypothetical protein